jgi:methylmalonyl-CoA mutase cobalamin-binding domain/chain
MSGRGRIVVGTLGLDQHEVGAMAVAHLLMRHGFEIVYLGRFNTPAKLAAVARDEDADVVGVSVHSWELAAYAGELVELCHAAGAAVAIGGSVLTESDERTLAQRGVDATFGPYAAERDIVARMDDLVARARACAFGDRGAAPDGALAGRVVAVTGAARGLGAAYVEHLLDAGAAVVANDLDPFEAAGAVEVVPGDVADPATAEAIVSTALARFGRLDAIVANAGLLRSGPLVRISPADFDLVQAVHVRGAFLLLQAAAQHWRREAKAGRPAAGAAVLTTSAAGLYGFLGEAAYSAAKAAVAALTLVAAEELARYDVTVNAIAPVARTRLTEWMDDAPGLAPEHVAPAVAWLVGDAARHVTGRVFEVGAGRVALTGGWHPVAEATGPADGATLERLVAEAPPPRPIKRATNGSDTKEETHVQPV